MVQRTIRELSVDEVIGKLHAGERNPERQKFLAMYSTWLGGIVKDPVFMTVPIDDHLVHRGDGVFEALKCVDGRIFALDRHLERLLISARKLSLTLPFLIEELHEICVATTRSAGGLAKNSLLRLYLSRGPGSFSVNPYDTVGSQVYLVVTSLPEPKRINYLRGVSCATTAIPVKTGEFATIKSCNYLQNVLMKKEAVDRGLDFVVSCDEEGFIAEGSTENFAIVSADGELLVPDFSRTLRGVTAVRAMELAEKVLLKGGQLNGVRHAKFTEQDVLRAREVFLLGTTIDCLPVSVFNGHPIGGPMAGFVAQALLQLLHEDMRSGPLSVKI
jgi:branched-chain amino acid aminotransferase